jgi:hypothetical protein
LAAVSPHVIDAEPDDLRAELRRRIGEAAARRTYDAYVLAYGLCGNTAAGLTCPVPLVMPRVHDCCALFLGSKERFLSEFGNQLSMRWSSCGYYERSHQEDGWNSNTSRTRETFPEYQELIEKYGEDNAEYIWDTLHPDIETPEAVYIALEPFDVPGYREGFGEQVKTQGKTLRVVDGDITYLRDLVNGPWDDARFLTVSPGQRVAAVYDMDRVVAAADINVL